MPIEKHVRILAILHIAHSALIGIIGIAMALLLFLIGAVSGDEDAILVLVIIGIAFLVIFMVFAVPGIVAGVGLFMKKNWGRILTLIIGFLKILDFPLGTALGVYTAVILLREDAPAYFRESETS
jgi:hypothetical protein